MSYVSPVVQVLVGRSEAPVLPQLDGPARAGDAVLELAPRQDVLAGELIPSDHAATLAHADLGRGVGQECSGERGPRLEELRDGADALAAFLLGRRQEVPARRLFRDPAQGELADHFPRLTGRTKRQVRGPLRQAALLLRRHQSPQHGHAGSRTEGLAVHILEDEDEGGKLSLCLRRRLGGGAGVPRDHRITARVHDSPRPQLEEPLRGGDAQRLDVPLSSLEPHEIGVQVHVQMRHRGREVVRQAGEGEGGVGQDVGPPAANRRSAAGRGHQSPGEGLGEPLVERLRRP